MRVIKTTLAARLASVKADSEQQNILGTNEMRLDQNRFFCISPSRVGSDGPVATEQPGVTCKFDGKKQYINITRGPMYDPERCVVGYSLGGRSGFLQRDDEPA
jgi:hypothetical protein